ncbi:hypothetical protein [Lacrimispora amygdalina]|uniref:hypothetical protein n=1 Tax=Lacrimispora amygdalina TaxID=253257 RepID=UPI000BE46E7D|nr:hypothetical protein [Lacrimispora amygdalina]
MPRGVRKAKSVRLREELNEVLENLQKIEKAKEELEERKEILEKELRFCENESILNLIEQSGLNADEVKYALERYSNVNDKQVEVAATTDSN